MEMFDNDEGAKQAFAEMLDHSVEVKSVTGVFGIHASAKESMFFPIMRCPGLVLPELPMAEEGDDMDYMWSLAMGNWDGDALLHLDWGNGKEIRIHFPLGNSVRTAFEAITEAGGKFGISSRAGGDIDDTIMVEVELDDEAFQMCAAAARLIGDKKKNDA